MAPDIDEAERRAGLTIGRRRPGEAGKVNGIGDDLAAPGGDRQGRAIRRGDRLLDRDEPRPLVDAPDLKALLQGKGKPGS